MNLVKNKHFQKEVICIGLFVILAIGLFEILKVAI